jgi:hypothetical protein
MLSATQTPKDGVGQEKTVYGNILRLKSKTLQKDRTTTLKITGMSSGAVKYVTVVVKAGKGALFTPPTTTSPPDDWRPKEAPEQGKEQRKERGERNDKQESKRR